MRIDDSQSPDLFEFASTILGEQFVYGHDCRCLGNRYASGQIAAVVIYAHMTDYGCFMHIASDGTRRWMNRDFLYWTFFVPFMQWGMERLTGLVKASSTDVLAFDKKLGFVEEGRMRCAFGNDDGIVLGMLRQECRFLNKGA